MKLTPKGKKRQAAIADALKKGLPLAGLLSSLMVTTGCDVVKGIMNRHTVGKMAPPRPPVVTPTEQTEEPAVQPSQDQQPESPAPQNNDAEPRPLMGKPAPPCEEKDAENEKQPRPLMGAPLPPPAEPPADKANQ
ncbi:MAG: hypothetical protein J6X49_14735 [Victivallales bacterium]|nr:hypothetical protein [Victivallales bacterium]